MKNMVRLAIVVSIMLAVMTGCELYQAVNVGWSIEAMNPNGAFTRVDYTVRNLGKIDLTGVNLEIGVDVFGNGTYPAAQWTPDFSINQNEIRHGSIDVDTAGRTVMGGAMVLSIDMDNPKD